MKKIALITLLIFYSSFLFSQFSQEKTNLHKYWRYRERLKNFVVPGECRGCGLPASGRHTSTAINPDNSNVVDAGNLTYPDETITLGHYIAVLASEYALLLSHPHPTTIETNQLKQTKEDLWYALETFNRLDETAEGWWRHYESGGTVSASPHFGDLNGFFIREDVPANFPNQFNDDGILIENCLNSSYFPAKDPRIAGLIDGSFTDAIYEVGSDFSFPCNHFNGYKVGPREESLDQVVQMMLGLSLCARYILPGTIVIDDASGLPKQFEGGSGPADIHLEVKAISNRIIRYMALNDWEIRNPITLSCVKATSWPIDRGNACKCFDGGATAQPLAYALAMVDARIQTAIAPFMAPDPVVLAFIAANYPPSFNLTSSQVLWENVFNHVCIGLEDSKILALGAAGHVWGAATGPILQTRCAHDFFTTPGEPHTQRPGDRLHFPLFHQAIYGTLNPSYPPDFYKCMMDHAQCYGPQGDDGNEIWSQSQNIILYGYTTGISSSDFNGLGYMFYFNMYNLVYPTYLLGSEYHYVKPFDLCEDDIVKTGFTYTALGTPTQFIESDKKTFIASNSITAKGGDPTNPNPANQDPYIIDNDNDPQPFPASRADITFMAKNLVHMEAGFEAHAGVEFRATINSTLSSLGCNRGDAALVSDCSDLIPPPFRSQNNVDTNATETKKLIEETFAQKESKSTAAKKSEQKTNGLLIIPNPNNGSFQISITRNDKAIGIKEIIVYDIMGKVVWENGPSSNNTFTVDITSYAGGIYYVRCVNEFDEVEMKKLVKQ